MYGVSKVPLPAVKIPVVNMAVCDHEIDVRVIAVVNVTVHGAALFRLVYDVVEDIDLLLPPPGAAFHEPLQGDSNEGGDRQFRIAVKEVHGDPEELAEYFLGVHQSRDVEAHKVSQLIEFFIDDPEQKVLLGVKVLVQCGGADAGHFGYVPDVYIMKIVLRKLLQHRRVEA